MSQQLMGCTVVRMADADGPVVAAGDDATVGGIGDVRDFAPVRL
jgi:hypothetical protein